MNPYSRFPYEPFYIRSKKQKTSFPPQHQSKQPGIEGLMNPKPIVDNKKYKAGGKLKNKVAIITGEIVASVQQLLLLLQKREQILLFHITIIMKMKMLTVRKGRSKS